MKVYRLFGIFTAVLCSTFAKSINKIDKRDEVNLKFKRDETNVECNYINSLLGQDEFFNCCEYTDRITCENGHIIKLYEF